MNATEWLQANATRYCSRMHVKMTPHSCTAFQNVHDADQNGNWKGGEFSHFPHYCKGCEHFSPRDIRDRLPGAIKRKPPVDPAFVGELVEHKKTTTAVCPVCGEKRQVDIYRATHTSFIESGGMCRVCAQKKRWTEHIPKEKVDLSTPVRVVCPICKQERTVQLRYTKRKLFKNGTCRSCAAKDNLKKRIVIKRDRKALVAVKCPQCGKVRQVHYGTTRMKDFTGTCHSCGSKTRGNKLESALKGSES